jgi:predicted MFS family arabinose efflux permease
MPRAAIAAAGFTAMLNMYAPQPVLPMMSAEFGVGPAAISQIMTVNALAVALMAPFTGVVADVLGRRTVIATAIALLVLPGVMMAFSSGLEMLLVWRFVQGLLLPPIFAVSVAYIGAEWKARDATAVTGTFIAATAVGGFSGRMVTAALAETAGWRTAMLADAGITAFCALAVIALLPRERSFVHGTTLATSLRQMLKHLRNARLVATFGVGFGIMFNFLSAFTYLGFRLVAPPFDLSTTAVGAIFATYLISIVTAPFTGALVSRFGRRNFGLLALSVWMAGILLTLAPSLPVIVTGLFMITGAGFYVQVCCQSFVATHAREGNSSAVGLYVTSFYVGGSFGGFIPGLLWSSTGWPGVVSLIVAMLLIMAAFVRFAWRET